MKRIDDIEVLRAWAIVLVLIEHSENLVAWRHPLFRALDPMFQGVAGVDLFFVVSGFVITRGLAPRILGTAGVGARVRVALGFWHRRAWRLLPAAWLWLALPLLAARHFNRSGIFGTFEANLGNAQAALLFHANAWFRAGHGVPELTSALFPYWTLSLEEQFYFVLPLLLIVLGRRFPLLAVTVVAYCLASPGHGIFPIVFRPTGLLAGCLLAFWEGSPSWNRVQAMARDHEALLRPVATGLLLFLPFANSVDLWNGRAYMHAYLNPVCALAVFLAAGDRGWFRPREGFCQAAMWTGTRSYSLYLVHVPIALGIQEFWFRVAPGSRTADHAVLFLAAGTILVCSAAEATFRWVETPLRRFGRRAAGGGTVSQTRESRSGEQDRE